MADATRPGRESEEAGCPLCGEPAGSLLSFETYDTHLCRSCDHRFNVHRSKPDDELVFGERWVDSRAASAPVLDHYARGRVTTLRDATPPGGKVLEIGCGTGEFLDHALRAGYDVYGMDTSPEAVREAGRLAGDERVFCGLLEDLPPDLGSFDLIAGFHVLEHVPDPVAFAREVLELLAPGGLLYLCVPNARGLVSRLRGRGFYIETHVSHFSATSLEGALRSAGFVEPRVWTNSFGGRWFDLAAGPAMRAAGWIRRPLNRRAFAPSEPTGAPAEPGRGARLLRGGKRTLARQYQLAGLATHLGGYPLWSLLAARGLGGELAVTARRPAADRSA